MAAHLPTPSARMPADAMPAAELDLLVGNWLTLPDVATALSVPVTRVRQLIREHRLAAVRRGDPPALQVPAEFLAGGELVKGLSGTLIVLHDSGYEGDAALRWLFSPDDSLPGRPIDALARNRGTEVKRRAQALAF